MRRLFKRKREGRARHREERSDAAICFFIESTKRKADSTRDASQCRAPSRGIQGYVRLPAGLALTGGLRRAGLESDENGRPGIAKDLTTNGVLMNANRPTTRPKIVYYYNYGGYLMHGR
jgi:hypothetical protein